MNKESTKDKLIGVIVTMASSAIMFLIYNLIGSFETKAGSSTKFNEAIKHIDRVEKKIDLALCYMNKIHCIKEGK